jgi:hypothetical protein
MNFPGQFIAVYPLIQYLWKTAGATPKPPFSLLPESSRPLATPFGTGEYPLDMAIFCSICLHCKSCPSGTVDGSRFLHPVDPETSGGVLCVAESGGAARVTDAEGQEADSDWQDLEDLSSMRGFTGILWPLPSGKHTKNYGKSPFFMGKSTINGDFQ